MSEIDFRGIIPPMITPLTDNGNLDEAGVDHLVGRFLEGGVHGLFVLGTTGEGPSLSPTLQQQMVQATVRRVNGRIPVIVGITSACFDESVALADFSAAAGAQAVVVAPPCYFPISQTDLIKYLENLAERLPLPAFLYNMPSHCKTWYEIETLRRAFEIPTYIGLKDSSGDMDYFRRAAEVVLPQKRLRLLIGPEEKLPAALAIGAHGGICGGAHFLPRLFVRILDAHQNADSAAMNRCIARLAELGRVYEIGGAYLPAVKGGLAILGLCQNYLAEPLHPLEQERLDGLRAGLCDLKIDRDTLE